MSNFGTPITKPLSKLSPLVSKTFYSNSELRKNMQVRTETISVEAINYMLVLPDVSTLSIDPLSNLFSTVLDILLIKSEAALWKEWKNERTSGCRWMLCTVLMVVSKRRRDWWLKELSHLITSLIRIGGSLADGFEVEGDSKDPWKKQCWGSRKVLDVIRWRAT